MGISKRLAYLEAEYGGSVGGYSWVNDRKQTGGDRFHTGRFDMIYAKHLPADPKVIVECGVFKGNGLAVWCDLFPEARVIGLDIDVNTYEPTWLKDMGAFTSNVPEVYQFDKYKDSLGLVSEELEVDVLIDDSCHKTEGILLFLERALPYLSDNVVVFIEDNKTVGKELIRIYADKGYQIHSYYSLVVMERVTK